MMDSLWIVATANEGQVIERLTSTGVTQQEVTTATADVNVTDPNMPPPPKKKGYGSIIIMVGFAVMFYLLVLRGPQKQKKQRIQMTKSLEKNDRIQTIGGIIGTIVEVKDDEIILKIDESNNTKMKIVHAAVGKNITKEQK